MKNLLLLSAFLLLASSCEEFAEKESFPAPNADFQKRTDIIIADQTSARFESTSTGDIDSFEWEFEGGLGYSSSPNPSYTFDFEGAREVSLTVSGPGGTDRKSVHVVVYPFDPNCQNVGSSSTHLTSRINNLRNNGLVKNGYIKIKNNYNVTLDLLLYSPFDWLNGKYTNKHRYTLPSGAEGRLQVGGSTFLYSNEWGIRIQGTNGVISCIRTVGAVGLYNGTQYEIKASDILEGT